jgi:hypothetical protein
VVFDGPPGHESGRFVEAETPDGRSVRAGEWRQDERGYWLLGPFLPVEREERLGR